MGNSSMVTKNTPPKRQSHSKRVITRITGVVIEVIINKIRANSNIMREKLKVKRKRELKRVKMIRKRVSHTHHPNHTLKH